MGGCMVGSSSPSLATSASPRLKDDCASILSSKTSSRPTPDFLGSQNLEVLISWVQTVGNDLVAGLEQ